MSINRDLLDYGRLIFELTSVETRDANLDDLLQRLYSLLNETPFISVKPRAVILLFNPRKVLVPIAQYGLNGSSNIQGQEPSPLIEALDGLIPEYQPRAYITSLSEQLGSSWTGEEDRKLFVLPFSNDNEAIGMVVICVDSSWQPDTDALDFASDVSDALASLVSRCLINETLRIREFELEEARSDEIRRLGAAAEYRDNETGLHVMRMSHYAAAIAKAMKLPDEQREIIAITAPMHDVGKIGISDEILLKPGKLSTEEFDQMKSHTTIGGKLLKGHDTLIEAARDIAMTHHEHWDGSGYPAGLSGEEIPILGRVCAVADVFDALTSNRPYKRAWSTENAVAWIREQSGRKFDPTVVSAFERTLPDILRIKELYREEIIDPNQILRLPEVEPKSKPWVLWDDSMLIGIDVIDEHHRYLVDLVNDLHDVVIMKRGSREVARILSALHHYAQIHFRAEEKMMVHYRFPALDRQQHQHGHFEKKLKEFRHELHINPLTAQQDILIYLRDWMMKHIKVEDAKLGELIR